MIQNQLLIFFKFSKPKQKQLILLKHNTLALYNPEKWWPFFTLRSEPDIQLLETWFETINFDMEFKTLEFFSVFSQSVFCSFETFHQLRQASSSSPKVAAAARKHRLLLEVCSTSSYYFFSYFIQLCILARTVVAYKGQFQTYMHMHALTFTCTHAHSCNYMHIHALACTFMHLHDILALTCSFMHIDARTFHSQWPVQYWTFTWSLFILFRTIFLEIMISRVVLHKFSQKSLSNWE